MGVSWAASSGVERFDMVFGVLAVVRGRVEVDEVFRLLRHVQYHRAGLLGWHGGKPSNAPFRRAEDPTSAALPVH